MKVASLDLGSNTTLMLIANIKNGRLEKIRDESTVTRMGQGIAQTGELHVEALSRVNECLKTYKEIMDLEGVDKVVAVATSAARDASNSERLFEIADSCDVPIQVIPGSKEAEITYLGSTFDQMNPKSCFVVDIGGGSTELVTLTSKGEVKGMSLDMGSVRILDLFIRQHPVPDESLLEATKFIDKLIERVPEMQAFAEGKQAVAVAGTPTTLAMLNQKIDFDEDKIHGFEMSIESVCFLRQQLQSLSVEQRKALPGMPAKRADVIVAGTLILERVMKKLSFESVTVSTKGVRYGLALQAEQINW